MKSINKVILIGRLGRDAETGFTGTGTAKSTFSIATDRRWKDRQTGEWKEAADWHNVVLWDSEKFAQYLTKGRMVAVEGRLQTRSYEKDGQKRYVTEVIADGVMLCGGGDKQEAPHPSSMAPSGNSPVTDDDIPF